MIEGEDNIFDNMTYDEMLKYICKNKEDYDKIKPKIDEILDKIPFGLDI